MKTQLLSTLASISLLMLIILANNFSDTDCELQCPSCGEKNEITHVHFPEGIWAHCRTCSYSGYDFIILNKMHLSSFLHAKRDKQNK